MHQRPPIAAVWQPTLKAAALFIDTDGAAVMKARNLNNSDEFTEWSGNMNKMTVYSYPLPTFCRGRKRWCETMRWVKVSYTKTGAQASQESVFADRRPIRRNEISGCHRGNTGCQELTYRRRLLSHSQSSSP